MHNFQVGNCVSIKLIKGQDFFRDSRSNEIYYGSVHILSKKDIARGYYFCNNEVPQMPSVDLNNAEHRKPVMHFRKRDQSLMGRVTKPVKSIKVSDTWASCYIRLRGVSTRVNGYLNKERTIMYFCSGNIYYKTKVYIDEEGFVRGLTKWTPLGAKQKRNSTRFIEGVLLDD